MELKGMRNMAEARQNHGNGNAVTLMHAEMPRIRLIRKRLDRAQSRTTRFADGLSH
jgi:hypothetical protein